MGILRQYALLVYANSFNKPNSEFIIPNSFFDLWSKKFDFSLDKTSVSGYSMDVLALRLSEC